MTWRELWFRLRGSLGRRGALEREMEREMKFHLDMQTQRHIDAGMTPEAARRQAKIQFGSAETTREDARHAHRARLAENLIADIGFALRSLRRAPAFTIALVLTLALGIGASTAMFTIVNAVLLRPLPIPQPENFTYLGWVWPSGGGAIPALTDLEYEFVRGRNRVFEAVAVYRTREALLGDPSRPQAVRGLRVTGEFFTAIGFTPRLGRAFNPRELETGGPAVAIISDGMWRTRFGADPGILGSEIRLDNEPYTVVGVLPPEFRFPPAVSYTEFVVPLVVQANPGAQGNNTNVIGRLRPGTSPEAIATDLDDLSSAFLAVWPSQSEGGSFRLFTHTEIYAEPLQRTLWILFGAVSLVLLIACANAASLLLVRAGARQREIAVRSSIGAGPARILQQLLTEGLLLTVTAAALGVAFSVMGLQAFIAMAPDALPAGTDLEIDFRVLAWALSVAIAMGIGFGFAATVPASRTRLQSVLSGGGYSTISGNTRIRETLVFLQTAIAIILLAGSALLTASFVRLVRVDPGFDAERVVAIRLGRLPSDYDAAARERLVDRILERIRAMPGVERAAAAPNLPLERGMNFPVDTPERPDRAIGAVELRFVSPDYLATLGIPLLAGRDFDQGDGEGSEPVAIVNESFARHFFDDEAPVGRTIQVGHFRDRWIVPADRQRQTRIVGLAADIHEIGLDRPARPTVLLPRAQVTDGTPVLLARGPSPSAFEAIRNAVAADEPRITPTVERLSDIVSDSVAAPRFRALLVGAFAGFSLLLAGIGIYGVIASNVQNRRREIALRLALGSNRGAVAIAVTRRCLINAIAGTLTGLVVFWAMRRVLSSWLFEIAPGDPGVLAAAVAMLALVAALASWIPARRAGRIDPATSLRLE